MNRSRVVAAFLISAAASAGASGPRGLTVRSSFVESAEPLTTEEVWKSSPDEVNAHRRRWVIERRTKLVGVETVARGEAAFGVRAAGLEVEAVSRLRGPGPWYRPITEFPCSQRPTPGFGTAEGARVAAREAARLWQDGIEPHAAKLELLLGRIAEPSAEAAAARADEVVRGWADGLEEAWRAATVDVPRRKEWDLYVKMAARKQVCGKAGTPRSAVPRWEEMMEPLPGARPEKPLVRAPARRWDGRFTVRATVHVGGKRVSGNFLLDSAAPRSLIAPSLLEDQGIHRVFQQLPGTVPSKQRWSGGEKVARPLPIDKIELSGFPLALKELWLVDTRVFKPPRNVGVCCDGVLGVDFLNRYAVEFEPGEPARVSLWQREGFRQADGAPWIEVAVDREGALYSACSAVLEDRGAERARIEGTRWETAAGAPLRLHSPWREWAARGGEHWKVECGDRSLAEGVRAGVAEDLVHKVPGFTAGIPFLARGAFTLDLPHGRIWFAKDTLQKAIRGNRSGLEVDYVYFQGVRSLKVLGLAPKGPALKLRREGLRPEMYITEVNGRPARELGLWDVESALSGAQGSTVTLGWKSRGALKRVTLPVF